jgi:DNA replication and repair protein RecF
MLSRLKLRDFRCFAALETEFAPGTNVIAGPNAQGKTSLLEACCVLLRLQSPRVTTLARTIRHGQRGFVLDGHFGTAHMQFYYGRHRRKLALDSVEQKSAAEYLRLARVVWFGNEDIALVRGAAEARRRFLDFAAVQFATGYRAQFRVYAHALRSRNHLLRQPSPRWREIAAFDGPLIEAGNHLAAARSLLAGKLQPHAAAAHAAISGGSEHLALRVTPGFDGDFSAALTQTRNEDARLRQTTAGPHRADLELTLNAAAADFGSEGQQRSIVLALKLGLARLLEGHSGTPPVLLIDDVFGELDIARRNALLTHLPENSQRIITTTHTDWMTEKSDACLSRLDGGILRRA